MPRGLWAGGMQPEKREKTITTKTVEDWLVLKTSTGNLLPCTGEWNIAGVIYLTWTLLSIWMNPPPVFPQGVRRTATMGLPSAQDNRVVERPFPRRPATASFRGARRGAPHLVAAHGATGPVTRREAGRRFEARFSFLCTQSRIGLHTVRMCCLHLATRALERGTLLTAKHALSC